jgi:hypothetical protein
MELFFGIPHPAAALVPISAAVTSSFCVAAYQSAGSIVMGLASGAATNWRLFYNSMENYVGSSSPVRVCWNGSLLLTTFIGTGGSPAILAKPYFITSDGVLNDSYSPIQVSPNSGSPGGNFVSPVASCAAPVASCDSRSGFMAIWASIDSGVSNLWSNFSCDGISWNPANARQINQSAMQSVNQNYASVCGNSSASGNVSVFFAMWQHVNEGWGSFSIDQGQTWSTPTVFFSDMALNSTPASFATENGFMVAYPSKVGTAPTSIKSQFFGFISPGMNNTIVPDMVYPGGIPGSNIISDISLSGTSIGFVASWIASDNNVYACFFPQTTLMWTNIVQVSTGGKLDNTDAVGISALADRCLITWRVGSNAFSSFVPFPAANIPYSRGLNSGKNPSNPGKGLF